MHTSTKHFYLGYLRKRNSYVSIPTVIRKKRKFSWPNAKNDGVEDTFREITFDMTMLER